MSKFVDKGTFSNTHVIKQFKNTVLDVLHNWLTHFRLQIKHVHACPHLPRNHASEVLNDNSKGNIVGYDPHISLSAKCTNFGYFVHLVDNLVEHERGLSSACNLIATTQSK